MDITDTQRMDWLVKMHVEVRTPMVYGSSPLFIAQELTDEEDEVVQTDLRDRIDKQIKAGK